MPPPGRVIDRLVWPMLGVMRFLRSLRAPDPIEIGVRSPRSADRALAALAHAASERRYSEPGVDVPSLLRLGGSVAGRAVSLTATPYLRPGVRGWRRWGWEVKVAGEMKDRADGSELTGAVTAPVPASLPLVLGGWLAFVSLLMVAANHSIEIIAVVVAIAIATSVLWTVAARHNQRVALRRTDRLTELLESILSEPRQWD